MREAVAFVAGFDDVAVVREAVEHPMATEVVRWLDGAYTVDRWEAGID